MQVLPEEFTEAFTTVAFDVGLLAAGRGSVSTGMVGTGLLVLVGLGWFRLFWLVLVGSFRMVGARLVRSWLTTAAAGCFLLWLACFSTPVYSTVSLPT